MLRLLDAVSLQTVIDRHQTLRGAGTVRRVLAGHAAGATLTRSELEERFLALCRRTRLPRPECNVAITLPDGGMATADAVAELLRRRRAGGPGRP